MASIKSPGEDDDKSFRLKIWNKTGELVTPREVIGMSLKVIENMIGDLTDFKGDPKQTMIEHINKNVEIETIDMGVGGDKQQGH